MNWHCQQIEERLSDYLDGVLSADEAAAFSAHANECGECAALVARVGSALQIMRLAPAPEPPAHLGGKILDATLGPRRTAERGWRGWFGSEGILWHPQFAMGAVTVVVSFLIVFHAAAKTESLSGFAALNPLNAFRQLDREAHVTYAHTAKFVSDLQLVYEIESSLQPSPEPATSAPEPQQSSPANQPGSQPAERQPKSQQAPRRDDPTAQTRNLYAIAAPEDFLSSPAFAPPFAQPRSAP